MPCRIPSSLLLALAAYFCVAPLAAASASGAATPDSTAAKREVRVFSDRAMFDLNPRPSTKPSPGSTRALDDSLHLRLPSPGGATALSFAGIVVPNVMLAKGGNPDHENERPVLAAGLTLAVLGPGLGYLYGGVPGEALPGQLLRAGSLGLAAFTVYGPWTNTESDVGGAVSTLVISSIIFAGATLYDLGNVGHAVERGNDRQRAAATAAIGMRPLPSGRPALALTVRF